MLGLAVNKKHSYCFYYSRHHQNGGCLEVLFVPARSDLPIGVAEDWEKLEKYRLFSCSMLLVAACFILCCKFLRLITVLHVSVQQHKEDQEKLEKYQLLPFGAFLVVCLV